MRRVNTRRNIYVNMSGLPSKRKARVFWNGGHAAARELESLLGGLSALGTGRSQSLALASAFYILHHGIASEERDTHIPNYFNVTVITKKRKMQYTFFTLKVHFFQLFQRLIFRICQNEENFINYIALKKREILIS